jgi:hypothetical protein
MSFLHRSKLLQFTGSTMAAEAAVTRPGIWDRRGWLIGLIAPCVLIGISSAARFSPVESFLSSVCPINLWGDDAGGLIGDGATIALFILLPGVLTVVARRRAFLWGALPLLVGEIFTAAEEIYQHEWDWLHSLYGWGQLLPLIVAWFVSSGVGLVVRGMRHRRMMRAKSKIVEAAAEGQSEVWPPAPHNNAH